MARSVANLFSAFRRDGKLTLLPGMNLNLLEIDGRTTMNLIMGGLTGQAARKRIIIPVAGNSMPEIGNGDRAYTGSFTLGAEDKPHLSAFSDEPGTCYVLVRTGFNVNRPMMAELAAMQKESATPELAPKLFRHGAIPMHIGKEAVQVAGVDALPDRDAEQVFSLNGWKPGMRVPAYTITLWRVFPNSAVLARDVNGSIAVIVGDKGTLHMEAADTCHPTFDAYFERPTAA